MKKLSNFKATALLLGLFHQAASAMDANTPPPLDKAWNWYGAPKLENVIGMPLRQLAIPPVSNIKAPRVAILDEYINPQACPIAQSCLIGAPAHYNFYEHDHGTHVANTVKAICPTARIHTDLGIGHGYNLVSALNRVADKKSIEVVNMSLGCKKESLYSLDKGTPTYNALVKVASAGKIMVKSLGNDHDKYNYSDHYKYVHALMHLAEDPALKGRLILVANSSYRTNDDSLHSSSNRPHRVCPYIITAPGTDITAKTSTFQEKTYTGTSMAAPMVSGMIAQLLYDFNKERIAFEQFGFDSDSSFKDFIIVNLLNNARKNSLKGKSLGVEFGRGIINCKNTRESIRDTLISKIMNKIPMPVFAPQPANIPASFFLTDGNWINGISRTGAGFFVPNQQPFTDSYKIGNFVKFLDGRNCEIIKLTSNGAYLNVYVTGNPLDPNKVGLPTQFSASKTIHESFFLTDGNWRKGIARNGAGFFVPNTPTFANKYEVGKFVFFEDASYRKISGIKENGPYLNVNVEGNTLNVLTVGLPSQFRVY